MKDLLNENYKILKKKNRTEKTETFHVNGLKESILSKSPYYLMKFQINDIWIKMSTTLSRKIDARLI